MNKTRVEHGGDVIDVYSTQSHSEEWTAVAEASTPKPTNTRDLFSISEVCIGELADDVYNQIKAEQTEGAMTESYMVRRAVQLIVEKLFGTEETQ